MTSQNDVEQELYQAIEIVLNKYGDILVNDIKQRLIEGKHMASGKLVNSVVFRVTHQNEIATLEILAEAYFKWVDQGRTPGAKQPPLFDIVKWLQSRRLDVLGTDYARTGLVGKQSKKIRNKAIALVQKNHPKDVVRRAWAISRAIGLRGIPALNVLAKTDALYKDRLFIEVDQVIAAALKNIVAREFEESMNNQNVEVKTTL